MSSLVRAEHTGWDPTSNAARGGLGVSFYGYAPAWSQPLLWLRRYTCKKRANICIGRQHASNAPCFAWPDYILLCIFPKSTETKDLGAKDTRGQNNAAKGVVSLNAIEEDEKKCRCLL